MGGSFNWLTRRRGQRGSPIQQGRRRCGRERKEDQMHHDGAPHALQVLPGTMDGCPPPPCPKLMPSLLFGSILDLASLLSSLRVWCAPGTCSGALRRGAGRPGRALYACCSPGRRLLPRAQPNCGRSELQSDTGQRARRPRANGPPGGALRPPPARSPELGTLLGAGPTPRWHACEAIHQAPVPTSLSPPHPPTYSPAGTPHHDCVLPHPAGSLPGGAAAGAN